MRISIRVDAINLTVELDILEGDTKVHLDGPRLQLFSPRDFQLTLEPQRLVPDGDGAGSASIAAILVRRAANEWVLESGYIDVKLQGSLPQALASALPDVSSGSRLRIIPEGLELKRKAKQLWGRYAVKSEVHHVVVFQHVEKSSDGISRVWKLAPSSRGLASIEKVFASLVDLHGLDLSGLRIDRTREPTPQPVHEGKLVWSVPVGGSIRLVRQDSSVVLPIRELWGSSDGRLLELKGNPSHAPTGDHVAFKRGPTQREFAASWATKGGLPLVPVLSAPAEAADERARATADELARAAHLWLRSERGWIDLGSAHAGCPWPQTEIRSGYSVPLHPWFSDKSGDEIGLRMHAHVSDGNQVHFEFSSAAGGTSSVTIAATAMLVEFEACAAFELPTVSTDGTGVLAPPANAPPSALVLASTSLLAAAPVRPLTVNLCRRENRWVLTCKSSEGFVDWRPLAGRPVLGDPSWAVTDPGAVTGVSAQRALIPRRAEVLELTVLPQGRGFSSTAPTATRPGLAGILRGISHGWFGLEAIAVGADGQKGASFKAGWRRAVSLLDERYRMLPELLAASEGVRDVSLDAVRARDTWRVEPEKAELGWLAGDDVDVHQDELVQLATLPPVIVTVFAHGLDTGWKVMHATGHPDKRADFRWGLVAARQDKLLLPIQAKTLDWVDDSHDGVDDSHYLLTAALGGPGNDAGLTGVIGLHLKPGPVSWQIERLRGVIHAPWQLVAHGDDESRVQKLVLRQLELEPVAGEQPSLVVHAKSVELLLGEGRPSYECPTKNWTAILVEGRTLSLSTGVSSNTGLRLVGGNQVIYSHPLPGLLLDEWLTTPPDGQRRFTLRTRGQDGQQHRRPLGPEDISERGERVIISFAEGGELGLDAVDLLAAGIELRKLNRLYLELERDASGQLIPRSGIIGWEAGRLAAANAGSWSLEPATTCHVSFKWSSEGPIIELNGVWSWSHPQEGEGELEVDIVLEDASIPVDTVEPVTLKATTIATQAKFVLSSGGGTWRWMSFTPLRWEPEAEGKVRLELWGCYALHERNSLIPGRQWQPVRGNFAIEHDDRSSNPSPSGGSCRVYVQLDSNDAIHTIKVSHQPVAGELLSPATPSAEAVREAPKPSLSQTCVEFIGDKSVSRQEPWLGALLCKSADGTTKFVASSATDCKRIAAPSVSRDLVRLLVLTPDSLSTLGQRRGLDSEDARSSWARRLFLRSGWDREGILEVHDSNGRVGWRMVDSPRLNRQLEPSWLSSGPRNYAAELLAPAESPELWRWPTLEQEVGGGRAPTPRVSVSQMASAPVASERQTSSVSVELQLDSGLKVPLSDEADRVVLRLSRHTPLAWDLGHRRVPGWRPDLVAEQHAGKPRGFVPTHEPPPPGEATHNENTKDSPTKGSRPSLPNKLELRMAAPRPGELLDLDFEVWATHESVTRASGRALRRLRTRRVGSGAEDIIVEAHTRSDTTTVYWVRTHPDVHDASGLVLLVARPRAVSVDPRQPIDIWLASGSREALLAKVVTNAGAVGDDHVPKLWLKLKLDTRADEGVAILDHERPLSSLREGIVIDITKTVERASGSPWVGLGKLSLHLPSGDHESLLLDAYGGMLGPDQPPETVARIDLGVEPVRVAVREDPEPRPPAMVAVFEQDTDSGAKTLLALGPESSSGWRVNPSEGDKVVWRRLASWIHHHPPGLGAKQYQVGVLAPTGAWSESK